MVDGTPSCWRSLRSPEVALRNAMRQLAVSCTVESAALKPWDSPSRGASRRHSTDTIAGSCTTQSTDTGCPPGAASVGQAERRHWHGWLDSDLHIRAGADDTIVVRVAAGLAHHDSIGSQCTPSCRVMRGTESEDALADRLKACSCDIGSARQALEHQWRPVPHWHAPGPTR